MSFYLFEGFKINFLYDLSFTIYWKNFGQKIHFYYRSAWIFKETAINRETIKGVSYEFKNSIELLQLPNHSYCIDKHDSIVGTMHESAIVKSLPRIILQKELSCQK